MKKALVTGAAGFLGSHLCDKLLAKGMSVIGMDNLITGSMSNIAHLETNPNFSFINHDVCKHITVEGRLDYILHFASPASPIDYLKIPIQTNIFQRIKLKILIILKIHLQERILKSSMKRCRSQNTMV